MTTLAAHPAPDPTDADDAQPPDRPTLFPPVRAPRIVLFWLLRLRWIAAIGQIVAALVALLLHLHVEVVPVAIVVGITAATNLLLLVYTQRRPIPTALILAVLLADMCLLTVLLVYTGGPDNPFSTLYLIHVAMAVTLLGGGWTMVVLLVAATLYALLFVIPPVPLTKSGPLPQEIYRFGAWANLVLVGGLIAYFSGRVNRSLRRRDMQINTLKERNARNEKLSTLTTLAAGAAHELGTPLATIALVAKEIQLAIAKLPASEDLIEDAKLIRTECDRCRLILDRMRVDVASDPRGGRTEMAELLRQINLRLRDDERERLKIEGPQTGLNVAAPCPAIEQSLTVMIRNAMDADPTGKPVRMVIRPTNGEVVFDVVDQGTGMTPEVAKRAGEPFFTTKEPGRGMGLGLFLVRLVAENYRGKFSLTSRQNEGTTSTLRLPQA